MSLLELKNIGKIYAQESVVSVGIRGVNLSFDRGEFVAITGKSGSGKSTLLNVISGMDSYEEGELFIEGKPTSHYVQADWEEYRKKYISFIFQDYNIIESFTVLQNVELALMNIESKLQRRAKAIELIEKVGLKKQINQKGSRLSGGQKQRTVIARALAKNSPIILADEPTGNLDAQSSKEIIDLLKEVSKDKLLIVVTHSFDEVEKYATRQIRVFDGAVESDYHISEPEKVNTPIDEAKPMTKLGLLSHGLSLGKTIFLSKPVLSLFMCLLLLVGTLSIYVLTGLCSPVDYFTSKNYIFSPIDGRVVVAKRDGSYITDDELNKIVNEYSPISVDRLDTPYDINSLILTIDKQYLSDDANLYFSDCLYQSDFRCVKNKKVSGNYIGKQPENPGEIFVCAPLSFTSNLKSNDFTPINATICSSAENIFLNVVITGYKTIYGEEKTEIIFDENGFDCLNVLHYFDSLGRINSYIKFNPSGKSSVLDTNYVIRFDMDKNVTVCKDWWSNENNETPVSLKFDFSTVFGSNITSVLKEIKASDITFNDEKAVPNTKTISVKTISLNNNYICEIFKELAYSEENGYNQLSLFFKNDNMAKKVADKLSVSDKYIAVSSKTEYAPSLFETIEPMLLAIIYSILWFFGILFISFFIRLCTSRTLSAFKGEMAIMRSMGIPVKVIVIGMFVRMLISSVPAFIFTFLMSYLSQRIMFLAERINYVSLPELILIFVGVLAIIVLVTSSQVNMLFGDSVKKSIRGGQHD